MSVSKQRSSAVEPSPERGPRARMRSLIIATAMRLIQEGTIPTVSDVAEAANVSRATAYRYFPNYASMLKAVVDEALGPILDWKAISADPKKRVAELIEFSYGRMLAYEATHRAALLLALDQWVRRRHGTLGAEPPIVRGNRRTLLRDAMAPLSDKIGSRDFDRLIQALSLTFGIEALIVLSDIWGLSKAEAEGIAVWASQALVEAALRDRTNSVERPTRSNVGDRSIKRSKSKSPTR